MGPRDNSLQILQTFISVEQRKGTYVCIYIYIYNVKYDCRGGSDVKYIYVIFHSFVTDGRGFRSVIVSRNDNPPRPNLCFVSKRLFISVPLQPKFLRKEKRFEAFNQTVVRGPRKVVVGRSFREGTQILCGSILGPQFSLETRSEIFELSNRPPRAAILLAVAIRNLRNRYSNLNTNFSFLSIYDLSINFILYEKKKYE